MSENHRWPVYGTEPHALYSHACVDACTIYVVYSDGINRWEINFEFWWQIFFSLNGSLDGEKRSFWVTIIKSLGTTDLYKGEPPYVQVVKSINRSNTDQIWDSIDIGLVNRITTWGHLSVDSCCMTDGGESVSTAGTQPNWRCYLYPSVSDQPVWRNGKA